MSSNTWEEHNPLPDDVPEWDLNNEDRGSPRIKKVVFQQLTESPSSQVKHGIAPEFHGVSLKVSAELGNIMLKVRDLINLEEGSVLKLNRLADEKVLILVNGKPFAHGEIVIINDRFGVRLISLVSEDGEEDEESEPGKEG